MTEFLQFVFSGLSRGLVFSLVATGFVLMYKMSHTVNLAVGEYFALAGFLCWRFLEAGWPLGLAITVAVAASALLGALTDLLVLRPFAKLNARRGGMGDTHFAEVMLLIGLSITLEYFFRQEWGLDPVSYAPFVPGRALNIGGASVQPQLVLIAGVTVVVLVSLWFVLEKTKLGRAMRACADNPIGAVVCGIDPATLRTIVFTISGVVVGIGGVLITPLTFVSWDSGIIVAFSGFIAAVFGGLDSLPGAVIGGITLGLIESLFAGYVSSPYSPIFAYTVLIALLMLRPTGLLGSPVASQRM